MKVKEGLELVIRPPKENNSKLYSLNLSFDAPSLRFHARAIPIRYLKKNAGNAPFSPVLLPPDCYQKIANDYNPRTAMITAFSEKQGSVKLFRTHVSIKVSSEIPEHHIGLANNFFDIHGIEPLSSIV